MPTNGLNHERAARRRAASTYEVFRAAAVIAAQSDMVPQDCARFAWDLFVACRECAPGLDFFE